MNANRDQFLQPKSMVTPGIAGGAIMVITNTIGSVTTAIPPGGVSLAISALFGWLYGRPKESEPGEKILYFVLNTLIVWSMAAGAGAIARPVATEAIHAVTSVRNLAAQTPSLPIDRDKFRQSAERYFRQWF